MLALNKFPDFGAFWVMGSRDAQPVVREGNIWEISIPFSSFCCEPNTALEKSIKIYIYIYAKHGQPKLKYNFQSNNFLIIALGILSMKVKRVASEGEYLLKACISNRLQRENQNVFKKLNCSFYVSFSHSSCV